MAQFKVISSSASTGYTGSISKMLSLGPEGTTTLDRIEWGNFVEPESSFTPTTITTGTVIAAAGSYIDGPIGRVKTGTEGGWLIYIES